MKKILSVILAIFLLLIPTIAATVLYFLSDIPAFSPGNELGGTLRVSDTESYFFNERENAFLNSFFNELDASSTQSSLSEDSLSFDKKLSASIRSKDSEKDLSLYLSLVGDCYWSDGKSVYLIDAAHSDSFINSKYAMSLYANSSLPDLTTASGYSVLPSRAQWTYTLKNGSHAEGAYPTITNGLSTYYSSSLTELLFSVKPDECSVRAYVDGIRVFDGSLDDLASSSLENEPLVKYEISAHWNAGADKDFFGEAEYSFYIQQAKSVIFSVDRTQITQGDFITVKAENVTDLSKISCTFSKPIDFTPTFFKSGNNAFALIPFGADLEAGTYSITFHYTGIPVHFDIEVLERPTKHQPDTSNVYLKLTDEAIESMYALIADVSKDHSDTSYAPGAFYNYENDFTIRLGFANIRTYSNGNSFKLDGVDFYCPSGENIPAFNNGIVCAVGEDALLGKYVGIEHGYGLKSWYCHVGEITVSLGNSVIKGDTVARSGISGMASSSGFYLMTTVFEKPVCPYYLYESNFILPK